MNSEKSFEGYDTRFKKLFSSSVIGVFISTFDGKFLEANNTFLSLIGYSREELEQGKIHRDMLTAPEQLHLSEEAVKNLYESGYSPIYEKEYIHKNGTRIPILIAVERIKKTETCLGFVIDISQHKRTEAVQAQLAAIVASSDDAIVSKTLDGIITSWNKAAERIFGWKADEAVGKHITIIIPHELLDEETTIISKIRRGEHIDHYQTIRVTKDGRRIYVSLTISAIKNREGKIIGASKIARDVTEKVEMEQRKDDFLSMVSHELKTPLTSMKMYLEILHKQVSKNSEDNAPYLIDKIKQQTDKLQEIVMDLLDVSAIETGKLKLHTEDFCVQDMIIETIETVQPITKKHTIIFTGNEKLTINADRYRLYQVITNLLTNAIKYSPDGGNIIVDLQKKRYRYRNQCSR